MSKMQHQPVYIMLESTYDTYTVNSIKKKKSKYNKITYVTFDWQASG